MTYIQRSRRLRGSLLLVLLTVLLRPAALRAEPPTVAQQARARAFAEELRTQIGSPGLSAAVAVDGRVVWAEGFGLADLEGSVRVSPDTKLRVGSLSKLLTAAAVARLAEMGKLDLDVPIQRYVPSFPEKPPGQNEETAAPVTPRLLAGHLAGIRHYSPADFLLPARSYDRLTDGLEIFAKDPLLARPGTRYSYSSYGYNLLGAAVEKAAGTDFLTAVDDLVLRPLGLRGTTADRPAAVIEHRARFYTRDGQGPWSNERPIDSSYKWPSGGFLSTAPDLVLFASAHLDGTAFLQPETLALLFTSQRTAAGEETGVGIGWRIGRDTAGRRILHHGGAIEGGRAFLLLYPEQRVAVALLANLSGARFAEAEAQKLAEIFMN